MRRDRVRAHPRVLEWMAEHTKSVPKREPERDEIDDELEYWQDLL